MIGFQPHSDTSREAAREIRPTAENLRWAVLTFLESRGSQGATDEEIQEALAMPGSTERPRRVELQQANRCHDSGEVRKTRSGRSAVVWRFGPAPFKGQGRLDFGRTA